MSFDNRIFNVNGSGSEDLKLTIDLALRQQTSRRPATAKGWKFWKDFGLVLYWHVPEGSTVNAFVSPLSAEAITPMVLEWLKTDEALGMQFKEWDRDSDHDGDNSLGWRVYTERWGMVGPEGSNCNSYSICAIRPVYLWHGK